MKALLLSATTSIALLAAAVPAQAHTQRFGSTLAESCYQAAEARRANPQMKETCDLALSEEALSFADRVGTHVNRGILSMISGNLDLADRDFDRAIALDPSEPEAWLNKGILQLKRNNSRAAIELIERAIELRTRKPAVAFYMRAIAHEDSGNVGAAYADLRRARALDPSWPLPAAELRRYQVKNR